MTEEMRKLDIPDIEGMREPHIPDTDPEDLYRYLRSFASYGIEGGMAWTCAAPDLPHPHSRSRATTAPGSCSPPRPECRELSNAKLDAIGVPRYGDLRAADGEDLADRVFGVRGATTKRPAARVPVGVYAPPVQPCEVCGRACVVTVDDRRVHPTCAREASGLTA